MNTTTQEYIYVSPNIITQRGWFQVVLNYYINGKRKQPWRSLGIQDKPGNKNKAKEKAKQVAREFEEELNTKLQKEQELLQEQTTNQIQHKPIVTTENKETETNNIGNMLYGDYLLEVWIPFVKKSIEITSYANYLNKIEIIAKYFNDKGITLNNLTKSDIKKFYTHLQVTRNIKNKTINRYHANIHKSLEDAITEFEVIEINPAHGLRKKEEDYIPTYYKQKDLERLFEVARGSLIYLHIYLAAFYGFRREEVCRLKMDSNRF